MLPSKLAERHVLSGESSEELAHVSADFLDKKACCMTEDNLTLWSYSYVLVAFNCWEKENVQSSVIKLSSLIITLMQIPPPHILLLQRHHINGSHDLNPGRRGVGSD